MFTGKVVDRFINYCRTSQGMIKRLKENPELADAAVEVYIDSQVERLFALRNYWIRHAKQERTYEGNQFSLYRKMFGVRLAEAMMKILGPYALTTDAIAAELGLTCLDLLPVLRESAALDPVLLIIKNEAQVPRSRHGFSFRNLHSSSFPIAVMESA